MHPALPLGVPEMDADHAAVEAMLDRVPHTRDEDLPALYAAIEAEVTSHFAREDVLMEAARVPVLECHRIRHRELLDAIAARRPTERTSPDVLRRTFAELAEAVTAHVDTVDRVTSRFLIAATAASLEPAQAVG